MMKSDWELGHVGLVVRDWNDALGYYQSTGMGISVGPQVVNLDFQSGGPSKFFLNDKVPRISGGSGPGTLAASKPKRGKESKPNTYKFMDKDCQVGSLLLEILQDRSIPYEGITHLCFNVPDVDSETARLLEKGCEMVLSFTQGKKVCENYIDTREFGHVIVWKFHGFGIAVRDIDKAVEYYESLDIAAFEAEAMLDSSSLENVESMGKTVKARTRTAQVGPVAFEFAQPVEGDAIYGESLECRGECISDMSFTVDDLEEETASLVRKGVPVVLRGKPQSGPEFAYFDTREFSGNIMVRLMQNA